MRSSRSGTDPLDPGPGGFAHRGLHLGENLPENSLAAFAAALEMGAGIECDIRLTQDHKLVVFHDADTSRLCERSLKIAQSTLAQLSSLRVGGQSLPTLAGLLELIAGKVPILLEVKVDDHAFGWSRALASALAAYRGPVGVMSFDPRIGRLLKTRLPWLRRGLVVRADLAPLRRRLAMWIADPQFIAVERTALARSWVQAERSRIPVYTWTVRTSAQRAQAQVHADAIIWESNGRPRI